MSEETILIGDEIANAPKTNLQWFLNLVSTMIGQVRFDYKAIRDAAARAAIAEIKRQAALTSTPVDDFVAGLLESLVGELIMSAGDEGVQSTVVFDGMTGAVWSQMSHDARREWIKNVLAKSGHHAPDESSPLGSIFWTLVLSLSFALVKIILERWMSR